MQNMKPLRLFTFIGLVALMGSCANQASEATALDKLIAERDSLNGLKEQIAIRMIHLETEIAALDTSAKLMQVTTIALTAQPFTSYFEVYGTVEAEKNARIFPETSGLLTAIHVTEGQPVSKGTLLMTLDGDVIARNMDEIKTQLELAKVLYEKQERLWAQQIGSEVQFLEAKNRKESLETRLATLQTQFNMTRIRAPFDGVIDQIFPKKGELVGPAAPVVRLVNLREVHIDADISERYIGQLRKGTPVVVEIPNTGLTFESEVMQVGQYIKPDNRTFRIQVRVPNQEGLFKPNLLASVRIRDYEADSAVTIPNSLLLQTPDGRDFVFRVKRENGRVGVVEKVYVQTGRSYGGRTEILDGLPSGAEIVEKGARSMKDGQRVNLIKAL
jgi:membrane fusion protein (multidrug efflux system)